MPGQVGKVRSGKPGKLDKVWSVRSSQTRLGRGQVRLVRSGQVSSVGYVTSGRSGQERSVRSVRSGQVKSAKSVRSDQVSQVSSD